MLTLENDGERVALKYSIPDHDMSLKAKDGTAIIFPERGAAGAECCTSGFEIGRRRWDRNIRAYCRTASSA